MATVAGGSGGRRKKPLTNRVYARLLTAMKQGRKTSVRLLTVPSNDKEKRKGTYRQGTEYSRGRRSFPSSRQSRLQKTPPDSSFVDIWLLARLNLEKSRETPEEKGDDAAPESRAVAGVSNRMRNSRRWWKNSCRVAAVAALAGDEDPRTVAGRSKGDGWNG